MGKAANSSQSQRSSTNLRARGTPTTPVSKTMTPPAPQSMVSPTASTSQPAETPMSNTYLSILGDVMGRFSPTEKMIEVFSKLAKKLKEEEDRAISTSVGALDAELPHAEPEALPHCTEAIPDTQPRAPEEAEVNPETKREAESMGEGESEERIRNQEREGETMKGVAEVVTVESDRDLSEKEEIATGGGISRRRTRSQQGRDREELQSMRKEAAILASAKREAAERKWKAKYVESPSKGKKPRPTSLGVVIREATADPAQKTLARKTNSTLGPMVDKSSI